MIRLSAIAPTPFPAAIFALDPSGHGGIRTCAYWCSGPLRRLLFASGGVIAKLARDGAEVKISRSPTASAPIGRAIRRRGQAHVGAGEGHRRGGGAGGGRHPRRADGVLGLGDSLSAPPREIKPWPRRCAPISRRSSHPPRP
jgi:hypothetical protein